jgi:hypothetical protein
MPFPGGDFGVDGVLVSASGGAGASGAFIFRYTVTGAIDRLRLPPRRLARRIDGLWRHTCFEVFVALGETEYLEFNFSPSGEWAAYAFAGYRRPAPAPAPAPAMAAPCIECSVAPDRIELTATLEAALIVGAGGRRRIPMGLSAVLETTQGALGYFAAHHPADRPDFHDRRGFVLNVDTAGATS